MTFENSSKDPIEIVLERYEREQREFEQHWLWKELGATPQEFFAMIDRSVKANGIAPEVWQAKLNDARKAIATRVQESKADHKKVAFQTFRGLRV